MVATRFEDLVVWQLADQLRSEVIALTATAPRTLDIKYCNQIKDAAASACRNVAEGFGRFRPTEFARYLEIAAGSLHEVKDGLHDGHARGYLDATQRERLVRLTLRALKANFRLREYLRSNKAADFWKQTQRRTREPREPREP
jgi:four helix bundle protein